jgi:rhodanese-related sulfurtransferase
MRSARALLYFVLMLFAGFVGPAHAQIDALPEIDRQLRANYPLVSSIKAKDLHMLQAGNQRPIILDVREADEFAVSHLHSAIRVDPDAQLDEVLGSIKAELKGKMVVVYCSVGVRSTELAERIRKGFQQRGVARIANLSEGIFGWHNARLPLISRSKPTPYVHPYDALWGQLLQRRSLARYSLQSAPPPFTISFAQVALSLGLLLAAIAAVLIIRRVRKA